MIFAKKKVLKPFSTCLQLIFWLFPCVPISQKIGFRVSIPPPAITLLGSTKVEHSSKINGLCLRKLCYTILSIRIWFFVFFILCNSTFSYVEAFAGTFFLVQTSNITEEYVNYHLDLFSTYIQFDFILWPHCMHAYTCLSLLSSLNRNQSESFLYHHDFGYFLFMYIYNWLSCGQNK